MSLVRCLSRGALVGARIGASLAVVGIMAQTLISTGLGTKIAGLVESLSGGNIIIALLITMFVSILLGCGCPTTAAYSLVAIVVVPALVSFGIEPISAHFFAFYFAIISALTPPVALAALAGAGIAGGTYFRTAINAFKLADMALKIELARNLLYKACWLKDNKKPYAKEAAMSKLYCSEIAKEVSDEAVQIHGGYGLMKDYDVERFYRDQRLLQIGEGTSEIQRIVISRYIGC